MLAALAAVGCAGSPAGMRASARVGAPGSGPATACPARVGLSVARSVSVGPGAAVLAFNADTLWVARTHAGTVTRVSGSNRRVVHVGGSPVSLAFGSGKLWVALRDADRIVAIDTRTLSQGPSASVPVPVSVLGGALGVWGLSLDAGALYPIDTASGGVGSPVYAPVKDPADMAAAEDELWVLGAAEGGLSPVNGRLGRIVRAGFDLPGRTLSGLSSSGRTVWIGEPGRRMLLRLDARSIQVSEFHAPHGMRPTSTAVGQCGVWAAGESGSLTIVDPRTGVALASPIKVASSTVALAPAGAGVWVSDPIAGVVRYVQARPLA
jgi:hypothetical protein